MTNKFNRGFTLIELLVVIAIIGILSSVVLASLNTARGKGANAAVKSNLSNIRAQGEIVYDNAGTGSYVTVCTDPTIQRAVTAAQTAGGAASLNWTLNVAGSATSATCHSAASGWAAEALLKVPENGNTFWCVDSTGVSKGYATFSLTQNTVTCP